MKKTLLLCFIHGFKGGDDTFGGFPEHLRALVSHALPKIEVRAIVYPKFETRGDLAECVSRFRDWLLEKVIDIEVSRHTPSPTVDPSVHTILIGHSMGGIVAADTILALTSDLVVSHPPTTTSEKAPPTDPLEQSSTATPPTPNTKAPDLNTLMFPYIRAVLAFDTPYLGIAPGVVAHGAEGHYNTASTLLTDISGLSTALWGPSTSTNNKTAEQKKALPASPPPEPKAATAAGGWGKWSKLAAIAGTGIAVAAGGTAAYLNRDTISAGWTWASSHLEFVGCLARPEDLKKRVGGLVRVNREIGTGWANLYTRLGKGAVVGSGKGDPSAGGSGLVGKVMGDRRTFCNLPLGRSEVRGYWSEAVNDAASDETGAHMTMFFPKDNPGYYAMSEQAKKYIMEWTMDEWYESATGDGPQFAIQDVDMDMAESEATPS